MMQEKLKNGIIAVILAFLIAFGGIGCLTTGFRMNFPVMQLVFWYLCIFGIGAVCLAAGTGCAGHGVSMAQ